MRKPNATEYNPYYEPYIGIVTEGDLARFLQEQLQKATSLLGSISEEDGLYRYAPDKWSVKQLIGHITDTERVMSYRLLCVARGDVSMLPGFDESLYVRGANFEGRTMAELLESFAAVRRSTIALIRELQEDAWDRRGNANGSEITARALAYVIAGHALHHFRILQERYSAIKAAWSE